jgi:phage FluMu protein Com
MPIRFRCAYCNQLLGIARRKAGQVVRCPTCAGQVVVPTPEEVDNAAGGGDPESPPGDDAPVFERSDFDQIFNIPSEPQPVPAPTGRGLAATGAPADFPRYDVESVPPPAPLVPPPSPPDPILPPGIFLSPKKATVLTVLVIVLVAVAFLIGLFVGLSLK